MEVSLDIDEAISPFIPLEDKFLITVSLITLTIRAETTFDVLERIKWPKENMNLQGCDSRDITIEATI